MANFNNIPIATEQKLTQSQLKQSILQAITDEYEAASRYLQISEFTTDEEVKKIMTSVAQEEMIHAGEFEALFRKKFPNDAELLKKGEDEANTLLGNGSQQTQNAGDEEEQKKKMLVFFNDAADKYYLDHTKKTQAELTADGYDKNSWGKNFKGDEWVSEQDCTIAATAAVDKILKEEVVEKVVDEQPKQKRKIVIVKETK